MFSTPRSFLVDHGYASPKCSDFYKSILVAPTIRPLVDEKEYLDVLDTPIASILPTTNTPLPASSRMQVFHPSNGDLSDNLGLNIALKAPPNRDDEYSDVYGSDIMTLQHLFHSQAYEMLWGGADNVTSRRWTGAIGRVDSGLSTGQHLPACVELLLATSSSGREAADRWKEVVKYHLGLVSEDGLGDDSSNNPKGTGLSGTVTLKSCLEKLFEYLDSAWLKKSMIYTQSSDNREILQQIIYERLAKHIRSIFLQLNWDPQYVPKIHGHLLQHLPIPYLICYAQALYSLRHKYHQSVLVDELNTLTSGMDIVTRFRMDHFIGFLHNDRSNLLVDRALRSLTWRHSSQPRIVCIRFPVSETSHRFTNMLRMLQRFAQVQCLDMPSNATALLAADLRDSVAGVSRMAQQMSSNNRPPIDPLSSVHMSSVINGWRKQIQHESNGEQPLFLFGVGAAAIIVLQLARSLLGVKTKQESQQDYDPFKCLRPNLLGLICLGPPVNGLLGERRSSQEKEWSLAEVSTLMVSGTLSLLGPSSSIQSWQEHLSQLITTRSRSVLNNLADRPRIGVDLRSSAPLPTLSRHIRVGGADHLLRLTQYWKEIYSVTQEQVDVFLMSEVRHFIIETVTTTIARKASFTAATNANNRNMNPVNPPPMPSLAFDTPPSTPSSTMPHPGMKSGSSNMCMSLPPSSSRSVANNLVPGASLLHPQLREDSLYSLPPHMLAISNSGYPSGNKAMTPNVSITNSSSFSSSPLPPNISIYPQRNGPGPSPSHVHQVNIKSNANLSSNYITTPRTWFTNSQLPASSEHSNFDPNLSGRAVSFITEPRDPNSVLRASHITHQQPQSPLSTPNEILLNNLSRAAASRQRPLSSSNPLLEPPRPPSGLSSHRYQPYERR